MKYVPLGATTYGLRVVRLLLYCSALLRVRPQQGLCCSVRHSAVPLPVVQPALLACNLGDKQVPELCSAVPDRVAAPRRPSERAQVCSVDSVTWVRCRAPDEKVSTAIAYPSRVALAGTAVAHAI